MDTVQAYLLARAAGVQAHDDQPLRLRGAGRVLNGRGERHRLRTEYAARARLHFNHHRAAPPIGQRPSPASSSTYTGTIAPPRPTAAWSAGLSCNRRS